MEQNDPDNATMLKSIWKRCNFILTKAVNYS